MIKPATPTGEPKYTQITASDKTLKDAALTIEGSTLQPHDGKLEWVDEAGNVLPDSTWVEVNTAYQWRFTPTDTNYTTLTGKIMLYRYYTIEATAGIGGTIIRAMPSPMSGSTARASVRSSPTPLRMSAETIPSMSSL